MDVSGIISDAIHTVYATPVADNFIHYSTSTNELDNEMKAKALKWGKAS